MNVLPDRVDAVVLARIASSKHRMGAEDLSRDLRDLAPPSMNDASWSKTIDASLERLRRRGEVDGDLRPSTGVNAYLPFGSMAPFPWKRLLDRVIPPRRGP